METVYLLLNLYDQASRDYLAANPPAESVVVIDWNVDTDAAEAYLAAGGQPPSSFPMTYTITTPAVPNLAGFFEAIQQDPTMTGGQKGILAGYFGTMAIMLQAGMGASIPTVWGQVIEAYGPGGENGTWLTPTLQTTIVGYGTANNLTL